jgi:hypothetical protein
MLEEELNYAQQVRNLPKALGVSVFYYLKQKHN